MDFAALPPEYNSARMYAGPGSGPMLAAATAWEGLATDLTSTMSGAQSVIANLTSGPWRGAASASMAAAAEPFLSWMSATATQAEQTAAQARAAASAYEAALAMTVPPPLIAANRALLASLAATNVLGQNTPAIAATEAHYGQMWVQDATAMYVYAASSAAASTLTPFTPPPSTTRGTLTGAADPTQLFSAVPTALQALASPVTSTSGNLAVSTSGSGFGGLLNLLSGNTTAAGQLLNSNLLDNLLSSGLSLPSNVLDPFLGLLGGTAGTAAGEIAATGGLGSAVALPGLGGALGNLGGVSAGAGQAVAVGALSVPPAWASAAPALSTPAAPVPGAGIAAGPVGTSAPMPAGMPLAGLAGRSVGGDTPRYGFRPTVMAPSPAAG